MGEEVEGVPHGDVFSFSYVQDVWLATGDVRPLSFFFFPFHKWCLLAAYWPSICLVS